MGLYDKASTVAEDPGPWSILIYGDWGAGKTVFGCQADGAFLLDCEKGRRSLLNHPELVTTPIMEIKSLDQARQFAVDLKKDTDERIKTVVVDTISTMQIKDMNSIMKGLPSDRDKDLPSQAEFNRDNRRIQRFCEELIESAHATNRNVVLLCHHKEDKDKEGNVVLIRPSTSPALTQAIAPMVSGVFYLAHRSKSNGEIERTLHVVATNKVKGKNRFGALPNQIVNPHFSVIEKAAESQRQVALQLIQEATNKPSATNESDKTNA